MPENVLPLLVTLLATTLGLGLLRRSPTPASSDGFVLRNLSKTDSDLSQPHEVRFLVQFPSYALAREAMARLSPYRFEPDLRSEKGGSCLAILTKRVMLRHTELQKLRRVVARTAAKRGGRLKGWTAEI